ncbi:MAG TPA: STAS domain-containing protein [Acidimicrobiales bacterium]|nr:STAS domain-containing protein [Acidimicrobiales bacterium]
MQEHSFRRQEVRGFSDFSLTFARDSEAVVVGVVGELDCASGPTLEDRLGDLIENQGNRTVVIDLTNMTFVDSSGLSVLVGAYRRLRERGGDLSLRCPSRSTRKVFQITGLDRVLPIDER